MGYMPSLKGVFDKLYVIHAPSREHSDPIRNWLGGILCIVKGIIVIKGVSYLYLMSTPRYQPSYRYKLRSLYIVSLFPSRALEYVSPRYLY